MENIASVAVGTYVRGKDINEWCEAQILSHGSHEKEARRLSRKNYRDYRWYEAIKIAETSVRGAPMVLVFRGTHSGIPQYYLKN